jgi:hypothetical protein
MSVNELQREDQHIGAVSLTIQGSNAVTADSSRSLIADSNADSLPPDSSTGTQMPIYWDWQKITMPPTFDSLYSEVWVTWKSLPV